MTISIQGPRVVTERGVLDHVRVVIKKGLIDAIEKEKTQEGSTFVFPNTYHLMPGFIDMHVHGVGGCDVMDGDVTSLQTVSHLLAKEGTTGFLATTMTQSREQIEKALCSVKDYANQEGARMLGVHLEGPFISKRYAGAQCADHAINPDVALFNEWQARSGHQIKCVTIAPELPGAMDFIRRVSSTGVIVSIGHTDADMEKSDEAIACGCTHGTHLFNAMRGIHHREPGAALSLLLHDHVKVEIIPDNIHVHPSIMQLMYKVKGAEGMIIVTDAMRAKCLGDGHYDLGGQTVVVKEDAARLLDGRLAGSLLHFSDAIQHMLKSTGCDLIEIATMASVNPALQLQIFDRKGSIAIGKDADLVVFDDEWRVVLTLCEGQISFKKEGVLA